MRYLKMKITYEEYLKQRQSEYNRLDIFYIMAFSDKRLKERRKEEAEKRGYATADELFDNVYSLGDGGYIPKSEAPKLDEWVKNDKLNELMQDPEFAESAFLYEMQNHEYCINWQGNYDVLSCFGKIEYVESDNPKEYMKQLIFSPEIENAFRRARRRYMKKNTDPLVG